MNIKKIKIDRVFKIGGCSAMGSARSTADDRPSFPETIRPRGEH